MVSHEQLTRIARTVNAAAVLALLAVPALCAPGGASKQFYRDDPILREPAPHSVKQPAKRDVDDLYDFLNNSFSTPRHEGKEARKGPHPALDVNTLGDVPDSAWYTNRHYYSRMSIE